MSPGVLAPLAIKGRGFIPASGNPYPGDGGSGTAA